MADLYASPFQKCASSDELLKAFRAVAEKLGVRRCLIVAPLPFHSANGAETLIFSWGFDEQWRQDYRQAIAGDRGKVLDHIMEQGRPVLWRDAQSFDSRPEANRQFAEEFFALHGNDGVFIPLFGPFGHQVLLSLSFELPVADVIDPRISMITRIGTIAHRRFIELYREETQPKHPLSIREQEVLHQMALGESKKQVARSLGISTSSVDTYQRRIFFKLDVSDRTEAVVRGLSMGLVKL